MTRMIGFERTAGAEGLRRDINRVFGWCIAAPALAAWPFLSLFPLFEMIEGEASAWLITTRSLLLATGFWPVLVLLIAATFATHAQGARTLAARPRDGGLLLGLYAAAWTTLYLVIYVLA